MDALNRSTTTTPLALAACLLVAGVLFLRAFSIFSAPPVPATTGSVEEQRLTALLTPVIGENRTRVSIDKDASGTKVWYILIDGPAIPDGMTSGYTAPVRDVALARGFDPARDRLELVQRPFADGPVGTLSTRDMLELGGLGFALLLLLAHLVSGTRSGPAAERATPIPADTTVQPKPAAPAAPLNDNGPGHAAILANAAPERSAALIRRWLQEDER